MKETQLSFHLAVRTFVLCLLLASSGCTVKLIANYDESTDRAVTTLQRKLATFFVDVESKLGTPDEAHENYIDTYKELRVDISAIKLRVSALPKNKITEDQIEALENNMTLLETLHQTGFAIGNIEAKKQVLMDTQKSFDTSLAAILRLELAKKRGDNGKE